MSAKLLWITPNADKIIAHCARVSNPTNQNNPDIEGLIKYCVKKGHWSIFETANACLEIKTSRAISAQIIRHKSFSFQEFSQRYAKVQSIEKIEIRRQDIKNRQNSTDDLSEETKDWWNYKSGIILKSVEDLYLEAIDKGIAKECARMVLPMASSSQLYMNGTIRSWIHYLEQRGSEGTQKEHRDIASDIRTILIENIPVVARSVGWK